MENYFIYIYMYVELKKCVVSNAAVLNNYQHTLMKKQNSSQCCHTLTKSIITVC